MKTFKQYLTEALMTEAVKIQPKEGISGIDKLYFSIVDGKPFFKKVVEKGIAYPHTSTVERDEMEEYIDLDIDDGDIKKYVTDCLYAWAEGSFDDPGVGAEWLDSDVDRAVAALKAGRSATVQAYGLKRRTVRSMLRGNGVTVVHPVNHLTSSARISISNSLMVTNSRPLLLTMLRIFPPFVSASLRQPSLMTLPS